MKCFVNLRKELYANVVLPSVFWDTMVGNCQNYSGSTGLVVFVEADGEISCFSDGAG